MRPDGDGLGGAHVHPQAFEPQPEQPFALGRAIKQQGERKGALGRVREERRGGLVYARATASASPARLSGSDERDGAEQPIC